MQGFDNSASYQQEFYLHGINPNQKIQSGRRLSSKKVFGTSGAYLGLKSLGPPIDSYAIPNQSHLPHYSKMLVRQQQQASPITYDTTSNTTINIFAPVGSLEQLHGFSRYQQDPTGMQNIKYDFGHLQSADTTPSHYSPFLDQNVRGSLHKNRSVSPRGSAGAAEKRAKKPANPVEKPQKLKGKKTSKNLLQGCLSATNLQKELSTVGVSPRGTINSSRIMFSQLANGAIKAPLLSLNSSQTEVLQRYQSGMFSKPSGSRSPRAKGSQQLQYPLSIPQKQEKPFKYTTTPQLLQIARSLKSLNSLRQLAQEIPIESNAIDPRKASTAKARPRPKSTDKPQQQHKSARQATQPSVQPVSLMGQAVVSRELCFDPQQQEAANAGQYLATVAADHRSISPATKLAALRARAKRQAADVSANCQPLPQTQRSAESSRSVPSVVSESFVRLPDPDADAVRRDSAAAVRVVLSAMQSVEELKGPTPSDGVEAALKAINQDLDNLISGIPMPSKSKILHPTQEGIASIWSHSPERKVRRPQNKSLGAGVTKLQFQRSLSKARLVEQKGQVAISIEGLPSKKSTHFLGASNSLSRLNNLEQQLSSRDKPKKAKVPLNRTSLQVGTNAVKDLVHGRYGSYLDYTVGFGRQMQTANLGSVSMLKTVPVSNLVKAAANHQK